MTKTATILVEIISTLGALASILWLFLDPGPEPFAASLVCLAVILGTAVQAQVKLAKIQDETLSERLNSIREIIRVVDNIPRVSSDELFKTLDSDKEFRNSLVHRLMRLFGLRRELIPYVEPELITMIDDEFEKFFVVRAGSYDFEDERLQEFAIFAEKLSKTVSEIEKELIKEHRKRFVNE